ncbi:MAG: hypothetical protein ABW164_02380 [Sphingobium sp.]
MTIGLPDIVGLGGSCLVVIAYAYSNLAKTINFILFNLLNLAGALMLMYSLTVHFNLASMALEFVWVTIALFGLFKALRRRAA